MTETSVQKYLSVVAGSAAGAADADLVGRFASSRDKAAFELLVWRHAGLVHRVCRSVLRDHHAAEDAAQATFLVLARKSGSFAGRGSVVGWLYRVARRVSVRHARRRARQPASTYSLFLVPAAERGPEADTADAVWAEVARLPERYRVAVLLCLAEGLTHADAARRTGWPVGTVASRVARGRGLLARRLARRGLGLAEVALPVASPTFVCQTAHAATAFATGASAAISPVVLSLAKGASMSPTILKLTAAALVCAASAGVWGVSSHAQVSPLLGHGAAPAAAPDDAKPLALPASTSAQRAQSSNNLKQIMLALHNYHDVHGSFPRDVTDDGGAPLLSWRVQLLPYLEQDALARQFNRNEAWDSEHNRALLAKMPDIFRTPTDAKGATKTYYQGFAGPGTAFEPGKKLSVASVTDGMSYTLGVIEAGPAVEWTKPGGIAYDPKKPLTKLVGPYSNARHAALLDGSVRLLKPEVKPDVLRLLIERADGMPFDIDEATTTLKPTAEETRVFIEKARAEIDVLKVVATKLRAEREKLLADGAAAKPNLSEAEKLAREYQELRLEVETLRAEIEALRQGAPKQPGIKK